MARNETPLEAQEQEALFALAMAACANRPELRRMFAIPNGGSRHPAEAQNLKRQGVKPGVPDICLPVPRDGCAGLFIELKRLKRGRISPEQTWWMDELRRGGYAVAVCRGWEEARRVIEEYLRGVTP